MENELLFDMRETTEAISYKKKIEKKRKNNVYGYLIIIISIIAILPKWAKEEYNSTNDLILMVIIVSFTIIIFYLIVIQMNEMYKKHLNFPLIDQDGIFRFNESGGKFDRCSFNNINSVYKGKDSLSIVLNEKSKEGFRFYSFSNEIIINVDTFISILANKDIPIKNKYLTAYEIDQFNQNNK